MRRARIEFWSVMLVVPFGATPVFADTAYGEAKTIGEGLVQVYADFESNGAPRSLGVRMTASALSMLSYNRILCTALK